MKWRQIQRQNITKVKDLVQLLEIEEKTLKFDSKFPLNLPLRLAKKIKKKDINDPIFLQFAPLKLEEKKSKLFVLDPTKDVQSKQCQRILHKYHARALLLSTSACAMNCRYCFRRHFDYALDSEPIARSIEYLKKNTTIKEIILSGGDPLSLSDSNLQDLFNQLNAIEHLKIIRIHSRFLIGIPERVTEKLLNIFTCSTKTIVFVQHINHKNELDHDIFEAFKKIRHLGIVILSQTVLLKGVNDSVQSLEELFWTLIENGITPYYIHQLDRVEGAMHFEVEKSVGQRLMQELQKRLPGYAIPKYVQEIASQSSKTTIGI